MSGVIYRLLVFIVFIGSFLPVVLASQDCRASGLTVLTLRYKQEPPQAGPARLQQQKRVATIRAVESDYVKRRPEQAGSSAVPALLQGRISSRSFFVMDAQTGRTLFARAADAPGQPASTIKVLTGLIAMQSLRNSEPVTTSHQAARMPPSKIYLRRGRTYAATDLINAVLMASANDASVALAEKIAGSERAFAKLMTKKAHALGARNTVCKTASGLTRRGQQSTARDLAMIFNAAMQNSEFAKRMSFTRTRTREGKTIYTHNRALWRISGAEGGKTGYTRAARQTYVGKFCRGDDELIVAIMGSETMWHDIQRLVEYGFSEKKKMDRSMAKNRGDRPAPRTAAKRLAPASLAALTVLADNKKISKL